MIWLTIAYGQEALGTPEPGPGAVDPSSVPFPVYPAVVPPPPDGTPPPDGPAPSPIGPSFTPPQAPTPSQATSTAAAQSTIGARALKPGEQLVVVYLRGLPSGGRVLLRRGDDEPVVMTDPGVGALAAELIGPPTRFLRLQLSLQDSFGTDYLLYDGLVVTGESIRETIAFNYQDRQAVRIPVSPSARTEVALDQRVPWWIAFGWGGVVALWMGTISIAWALRGRGTPG